MVLFLIDIKDMVMQVI